MKKVLALVLAAVMALSLATVVSAKIDIIADDNTPDYVDMPDTDDVLFFDGDTLEIDLIPGNGFAKGGSDGDSADPKGIGEDAFLTLRNVADTGSNETKVVTNKLSLSYSVSSNKSDMIKASIDAKSVNNKTDTLTKKDDGYEEGKVLVLKLDPADEYFTVEEHEVKIKLVVVQKGNDGSDAIDAKFEKEYKLKIKNKSHGEGDFVKNADGKVEGLFELSNPVIEADVFTGIAKDKALTLDYGSYTVKFGKVSKQNTALYLKAKTGVLDGSKSIASIAFKPTRVKDAATITMPIGHDNQNYYGETVYVYKVVDGKPTGEAIPAEVVNHNSIVFNVPAGETLGTYAAYGAKAEGEAEKPAIPETGANDIVNLAIVFSVVALAAAGFVAVKKAGK